MASEAASFEIRQLRYAIAAADHGSFYRAARALHVDQSTLSRSILRLERAIGTALFKRSRAGVSLTRVGASFIRAGRLMVGSADRMVASMRAAGQGRAGSLIVGHNSSISAGHLRATILAWQKANPEVELRGVEQDRSALMARLDAGEIDIVILQGDTFYEGYRREPFWSERLFATVPTAHPLSGREVIHWTDLIVERFVVPEADPGPEIRDMLLGRLSRLGTPPDIAVSQTSRETVLGLLSAGRRLSLVCEGSSGTSHPEVVYRPICGEQGPALVSYSGYWQEENASPPLKRFLSFVQDRYGLTFLHIDKQ